MPDREPVPNPSSPADDEEDPRVVRTREAVFEAVSHQQVAAEAGIGRATVYRHWPTRTDLLVDAVTEVRTPQEWQSSGDLATDLDRGLERLQRTLNTSPLVPQLVALIGRAEWDPELRETKARLLASGTAGIRRALEAAIDRHELPTDHDLDATVARLAGPLFYRRVLAHAPVDDAFVTEVIAAYVREVTHGG
jgi:AcrR family transcriptional regulator